MHSSALGRADNLALFLELMRKSLKSARLSDRKIAERSRALPRTASTVSCAVPRARLERNSVPSTTLAGNGVEDHMGYPVAEWHASIHIWQPNPEAQAFESLKRFEPGSSSNRCIRTRFLSSHMSPSERCGSPSTRRLSPSARRKRRPLPGRRSRTRGQGLAAAREYACSSSAFCRGSCRPGAGPELSHVPRHDP